MSFKSFLLTLLLGVGLVQLGVSTCAKAEVPYEVQLEDESGRVLPTYAHQSQWFAQGNEGQRYNVRVINRSARRVEAVVSVDGRDVLSGKPGDFQSQRGYLVEAYGSVLIEGFRTSLAEVASFRFTRPDNSYSARMGTPENVGVVGAAFFPEMRREPVRKPIAPMPPPMSSRDHGSAASRGEAAQAPTSEAKRSGASPSAQYAEERESNIGTEYGEQRYSAVREVSFQREHPSRPTRVVTLRYDDYQGLVARGVLPRPARPPVAVQRPQAFPVNGFAPPPPPRSYWN